MLAIVESEAASAARTWLEQFNAALASGDPAGIAALFREDGHWRDILAMTGRIETLSGRAEVAPALLTAASVRGARGFMIDEKRTPPREVERAGEPAIEAIIRFETSIGPSAGILRIKCADAGSGPLAWTLMTALHHIHGHDEETERLAREEGAFQRDFGGPNWMDKRREAIRYENREPTVLVVGGGHAGLAAAASLGALGVETLIVDRMARVGDNWRLRYHGLKLHNQVFSNHLPYLPFPSTWPNYIAKDKIANWLEHYAEIMEINFWIRTNFEGADYDPAAGRWNARLSDGDGGARTLHPSHIVMATSVSSTPNMPDIPTLHRFAGAVLHSSQFSNPESWRGKPVFVLGTGTSAHDIAQELYGHGARVTMVQRSPTLVVNVEPSAQLYDGIYYGDGPPREDRDLINTSFPLPVMRQAHKLLTARCRELDASLLEGLERVGFRLEFGEDGTGWPLKYRTRGGGYYFNVGCSELIVRGEIGLIQYHDIETFTETGVRMKDGSERDGALAVLATGYKGPEHLVGQLFGDEVKRRVGQVWGLDSRQELANMWMPTPQKGLWFTGGSFSQCRMYSRYLAMAIKAEELGLTG